MNEFSFLGTLLHEIRKSPEVDLGGIIIDRADDEISRIRKSLLHVWSGNLPELGYYLDFHYHEVLRLQEMITKGMKKKDCELEFMSATAELNHTLVFVVLTGLEDILVDIKLMLGEADLNFES